MHHVRFRKHMDFSKSLKDRVEERRRRKEEEARRLEQLEEEVQLIKDLIEVA